MLETKGTSSFPVPVLFIIFNRPHYARVVLEAIRKVRPAVLIVAADGPRTTHPQDRELCEQTRALIDKMVDWPCRVIRNFSDTNVGCGHGVSSAISAALVEFEEVIILEDDCVPEPTFFRFAAEMLERYRDDQRVMLVSGTCPLEFKPEFPFSYVFTRFSPIWGWATWRRAWKLYDFEMHHWPDVRGSGLLRHLVGDQAEADYLSHQFDQTFSKILDTWDYQWLLSVLIHHGLAAYPVTNQIRNIGEVGVHFSGRSSIPNLATGHLVFPLRHPPVVYCDPKLDRERAAATFFPGFMQRNLGRAFPLSTLPHRILQKVRLLGR